MNEEGISSKDVYYEGCLDGQMAERAAIVAWLRFNDVVDIDPDLTLVFAGCIERGEHLDGLREGGGATRPSLGNRPPHHLRGDDE